MHPPDVAMPMTNEEFAAKIENERAHLTALGVAMATADLYRRGYSVSRPLDSGRTYDLVVDRHSYLFRVAVLVALPSELSVKIARVSFRQDEFGPTGESYEPKYNGSEFDFLAIVDRTSGEVHYVPSSAIDFAKTKFWIRESDRATYKEF